MAESLKVMADPEKVKDISMKDGGTLVVWKLTLARPNTEGTIDAELLKKPGNDPPSAGTMVLGDLSKGEYGWKLKLANEGGQRSGGQRGGPKSPDERRSIERQVSAKVAADIVVALIRANEVPPTSQQMVDVFGPVFDAVDAKIASES